MEFLSDAECDVNMKDEKTYGEPITRINISGGEPLAHPDLYKILKKCYSLTPNVYLYTNMVRNIIYNANVAYKRDGGYCRKVNVEANVLIVPGEEIYIPDNVDKVHLLKLTKSGRANPPIKPEITASHNFFDKSCEHDCEHCNNRVLQADEKIVPAPCKKEYGKT